MSERGNGDGLAVVERTFRVVSALRELNGARVTELAEHTGLANSTVHRHLNTLYGMGYVVKEGDVYDVGLGFLDVGEYARNRKEAYGLARPKVEELAEETNERCQFMVEEHGRAVYVYVATGTNAVTTDARIGNRLYLHTTSVGKSILAHLPDRRVEGILDRWGLPAQTDRSITSREELYEELQRVREEGVAYNRGGNVEGLRSVGCPLLGPDGTVLGAVSISGPTHRMKGEKYDEQLPGLLLGAANEIELKLEYRNRGSGE